MNDLEPCESCDEPTDGAICDLCRRSLEAEAARRDHALDLAELLKLRMENKRLRALSPGKGKV